jgi:hypothetical protein
MISSLGASWPAWGQAAARLRERASRNRCDRGRSRDGAMRSSRRAGARLGRSPEAAIWYRRGSHPARRTNQPFGIVAAVELSR